MISVEEATEIILNNCLELKTEDVKLENSEGRILAEDIFADRDFPPFNRVGMDGVAISSSDFNPDHLFPIEGIQAAGAKPLVLENKNNAIEIMTGAVLPKNTDAVVRYEDFDKINNKIKINLHQINKWQNVHLKGNDRKQGEIILQRGMKISAAEIGIAATEGKLVLKVLALPKLAIFSTGDELVNVEETPLPYQIRKSNVHVLSAALKKEKINSTLIHINDEKEVIKSELKKALEENDFLILSGGVSKGKFDYIPEILNELGVEKLFHKVRQRPGKPFWFGKNKNGKIVFALPGNPVSTFMCLHRYVLPWLRKTLTLPALDFPYAVLKEDFIFNNDLQYFLQVKIEYSEDGKILARPVIGKGSGDLANLINADGFMELPKGKNEFKAGEAYPFIAYR